MWYLIDRAKDKGAEVAFISGDFFANSNPSPEVEVVGYATIKRMLDGGIKPIMLIGNHELPKVFTKLSHPLLPLNELSLENLIIADKISVIPVELSETVLYVVTLPYPTRALITDISESARKMSYKELCEKGHQIILQRVQSLMENIPSDAPVVFMGHIYCPQSVPSGWRGWISAEEITFPLSALKQIRADYFALGHIHKFQDLSRGEGSPIVYPGSPERLDFGEEKENKGGVIGKLEKIENGWKADYQFIQTPARKFVTVEVDIRDMEQPNQLIKNRLGVVNIKDCIVRLIINLRRQEERLVDKQSIGKLLEGAFHYKFVFRYAESLRKKKPDIAFNLSTPISALASYIDTQPELKEHKHDLLELAEKLLDEKGKR